MENSRPTASMDRMDRQAFEVRRALAWRCHRGLGDKGTAETLKRQGRFHARLVRATNEEFQMSVPGLSQALRLAPKNRT